MKIIIGLGAFLFTCGASLIIYNLVHIYYEDLPTEVIFVAILLMVIPVVALISWVIAKAIGKKE